MKRYLWTLLALVGVLFASCSDDKSIEQPEVKPEEIDVVFVIETPDITIRAGEGELATKLYAAVYSADWSEEYSNIRVEGEVDLASSPHVSFRLVSGKTYNIVFWAQAEGAPYRLNYADKRMELKVSELLANDERCDAFFHVESNYKVSGASSKDIVLRRPFAQLNVATKDWSAAQTAGINITKSSFTIKAHTWMSLVDGKVSQDVQQVTYALNSLPQESFTASGESYTHLSIGYLLVGEKELVDVTFTTDGATPVTREWESVPLQRNYRTNILGNILTSTAGEGVSIDSEFGGEMEITSVK